MSITRPEPLRNYAPPQDPVEILHHDDDLIFVNKPAGLLSVPGKALEHRDCLEHRMAAQVPGALLVHRLDMDTSGIIVFAANRKAQRHLGLQFERRHLSKTYRARVQGRVGKDCGVIDLPLTSDWPNRPLQKVCHETGRPSQTDFRVLERGDEHTDVELVALTGRTHQLRVHLCAIGHPILGDRFYAPSLVQDRADRLMLHALSLSLRHPTGGREITVTAPMPF